MAHVNRSGNDINMELLEQQPNGIGKMAINKVVKWKIKMHSSNLTEIRNN
jgi:hypothetical protein